MKLLKLSSIFMAMSVAFILSSCTEGDILTDADIIQNISKQWTCAEASGVEYDVTIQAGAGENEIKMFNFNDYGSTVATVATVSGTTITISPQNINGDDVFGTGTINADYTSISFTYTVDDGGGEMNITASFSEYVEPVKKAEKVQ